MTGEEELAVRQARGAADAARELVGPIPGVQGVPGQCDCAGPFPTGHAHEPRCSVYRWAEYDDLCLTCAGRGWVDLLPLTRAPGTGPREDCRDCGGTGKAPQ